MSGDRPRDLLAEAQPFPPRPLHELQAEWRARVAGEEPAAHAHEHGRLYDALETAAQRAEVAGHDLLARHLRDLRRHIAAELARGSCGDAR